MLLGIFVFAFCICISGCILWYLFDAHFVLPVINDERRYLSLGSPSGFINYNHTVSLWTLLHLTMVSSVDVHCKRDSLGFFSLLDVSHNELLSEINLSWARLPSFGLESGKFRQNNMASASTVLLNLITVLEANC